ARKYLHQCCHVRPLDDRIHVCRPRRLRHHDRKRRKPEDGRQRTAGICEQHRHHTREHLPGTASDRLHNEHHAWCSHLRRAQCNEHRILRDRGQSSLCARHHFVRHTVLHLHPCEIGRAHV